MHLSVPNILTILRISLIPIFIFVFYNAISSCCYYYSSAIIFTLAAITDWLDGYLARKLGQTSPIGAFLDPVADKLIVVVALVLLVEAYSSIIISIATIIIVCREIIVSALREWMAVVGQSAKLAVSSLGKVKTFTQMLAIILLLSQSPKIVNSITYIAYTALLIATILTAWSMVEYFLIVWRHGHDASE